jgi:hypothetical protein
MKDIFKALTKAKTAEEVAEIISKRKKDLSDKPYKAVLKFCRQLSPAEDPLKLAFAISALIHAKPDEEAKDEEILEPVFLANFILNFLEGLDLESVREHGLAPLMDCCRYVCETSFTRDEIMLRALRVYRYYMVQLPGPDELLPVHLFFL